MPNTPDADLLYRTLDRVIAADAVGALDQENWVEFDRPPEADTCEFLLGEGKHYDDCQRQQRRVVARLAATGEDCGSTACFAGWSLIVSGGEIQHRRDMYGDIYDTDIVLNGTRVHSVGRRAQLLLGLSDNQCNALFGTTRTLADLKEAVDAIVAGKIL